MSKPLSGLKFLLLPLLFSNLLAAQEIGLDEQINDAFMPIATAWENLVLSPVPIGSYNVPLVLILLVIGASFFTLYFKFPSITQFITAIQTVRGKYDSIENHESVNPEFSVAGDVIGILKDESRTGEVSHFQALATAV